MVIAWSLEAHLSMPLSALCAECVLCLREQSALTFISLNLFKTILSSCGFELCGVPDLVENCYEFYGASESH